MEKSLDPAILNQFTGSEHWYRHGLVPSIVFTDGAKYVADQAGAYWLLDEIALAQRYEKAVAAEEFQVWKLAAPRFIEIDGKRYLWRDLLKLRQGQRRAAAKGEQPPLFELREDRRPETDRSAAGRYREPSLFSLLP